MNNDNEQDVTGNCPKCGAEASVNGMHTLRFACESLLYATDFCGNPAGYFYQTDKCTAAERDQLKAEVEKAESVIFPYVSDLEEPLSVLVTGLGARYDLRGETISSLRAEVERLEMMNKKLAIAAGAQANKLGAKCERYRAALGKLLKRCVWDSVDKTGWIDDGDVLIVQIRKELEDGEG